MELRKDYVLDRWVVIATERKKRPQQFKHKPSHDKEGVCFFCPGNEHMTPPEIGRVPLGDSWKYRWFPNKFPAVSAEGDPAIRTHNDFFTFASAYGHHEVIVETPDHKKQLWDLSKEEMSEVFRIYNTRIIELSKQPNIKYITIFKNHGREAGTSLIHSHTQLAAISWMPKAIQDESKACKKGCPYCRIIQIEKDSNRRCFENNNFVAFAPYASRFGLEVWVFPKQHMRTMAEFSDEHYYELADIMQQILLKLKEIGASYNYYLHYSPKGEDLHFHIEVTPRVATWAGFEFSTETIINAVPPEDAARFYREEEVK
jgi:UDPglucose--hexose-1-phosphate uridylyltransferase